jgi:histidinol-phosphate aminotransferase
VDLRYLPDEADWLDPAPADLWEATIRAAPGLGAGLAESYPVDDPYGGDRGAPVVGRFFGIDLAPEQVTFAAGVTGLLHALAALVGPGPVVAPELVHPDLEVWAAARGARVELVPGRVSAAALVAAIEDTRPSVVHFDRPAFGNEVLSLADVERVASAAAAVGAAVVIDEAPAPYLGIGASAARLAGRASNLVVLRGFTKAYSLGGMRAGFAVASGGVAECVRAAVPPLQVGEPALAVALRVLEAGDVFGRLRARIRATKPRTVRLLEAAGLAVDAGDPDVPAAVIDDTDSAAARVLDPLGIVGLRPVLPPGARPEAADLVHVRTPVDDERIGLLATLLGSVRPRGEPVAAGLRP